MVAGRSWDLAADGPGGAGRYGGIFDYQTNQSRAADIRRIRAKRIKPDIKILRLLIHRISNQPWLGRTLRLASE